MVRKAEVTNGMQLAQDQGRQLRTEADSLGLKQVGSW